MTDLLLIADDLTGVLDSSVAFVSGGVEVYPLPGSLPSVEDLKWGPRVVAVNAATRHMSPQMAADAIALVVERARLAGVRVILKKTDSALRGNVGAELGELQRAYGGTVHFVPAFPQMGRITLGGVHLVDGVPVSQSSFGRDPFEPVEHSAVCDVIAQQSAVNTCVVERGARAPQSFEGVAVYDMTSQDALDLLAEALLRDRGDKTVLLAGCAGLARSVARALGCKDTRPELAFGNVLALCGSVNPASKSQCAYAAREGAPTWAVDEASKKDPAWPQSAEFEVVARAAAASWRSNPLTVVDASSYTPPSDGCAQQARTRMLIASNLGRLSARLGSEAPKDGYLLVMGGDVLLALVEASGARSVRVLGEASTGVVASLLAVGGKPLCVLSKSGGFGDSDLFVTISQRLDARKGSLIPC